MNINRENRLDINGSGYHDPTPGKALRTILASGEHVKTGDIWTAHFGSTERRLCVLAINKKICFVLVLNDESKNLEDKPAALASGRLGYYIPGMLTYKFLDDLEEKVDSVDAAQLDEMKAAVARCLNLPELGQDRLAKQISVGATQLVDVNETIIRLTAERDLYRAEYRELLSCLTKRGKCYDDGK